MEECVILFLHHKNDAITRYHLELFEKNNPHYKIIPLNPQTSPKSSLWLYDNMWMYNDVMIYDWLDSNNFINAKRYCWFDWDTLCNQSVSEYYKDHWDMSFVGTNLYTINSNNNWQWFDHARKNKTLDKYHNKFIGVSPFCGILTSREALFESLNQIKKENELWKYENNELRLSTCANICDIPITQLNRNSVQAFTSNIGDNGQIFHPQKKYNMKNKAIFIDLGTHNCQGLLSIIHDELDINNLVEIHAFEPNPSTDTENCLKKIDRAILHKQAAWINNNDKLMFNRFGFNGTSQGCLLAETGAGKEYLDFFDNIYVEVINFWEFIMSLNQSLDIYIKIDIEYAEYFILKDMLDKGWPKNIKRIWVEWHGQNLDYYRSLKDILSKKILEQNTTITEWH